MSRSKYGKGTGGGPKYDEAFEDEAVEEFLNSQKKKYPKSSELAPPDEDFLNELMLATLTKPQVEGIDGFDSGSNQFKGTFYNCNSQVKIL